MVKLDTGIDQERLIADFMTLVSIGSHSREESHVAAYIRGAMEELKFTVEEDDAGAVVGGDSGNLIVRVPGDETLPTVMMLAHMDTAAPGRGVQPILHEDRITSDGTTILGADNKVGIAGLIRMLRVLARTGEPHPPLEIIFTVCEEIGLLGARALHTDQLRASYGFMFDSDGPMGFVVTQAPAQSKLRAIVHGKAAHAGYAPERGISAIEVAAHAISKMRLGRIDSQTTANIGLIEGGFATNVVCAKVELLAEARSHDEGALQQQQEHMTAVLQETARAFGTTTDIEWFGSYGALHVPEDSILREIIGEAMSVLDIKPQFGVTGGGSDANVISGKGIPIVNMAVGYHRIHTLEEWIRVPNLIRTAELMLEIVRVCTKRGRSA